ncbi:hypothetical protein C8J56DRAFT_387258 [Mycena floridula]|nr:hypothetical protein C8J56DRAFT_387258 [Mycena floridula]
MGVTKFRVAVCGGGIGGLAFAAAMSKHPNIKVDVYESTSQFSSFGAGIGVWPRAWNVLRKIGVDKELAKLVSLAPTDALSHNLTFRKSDQARGFDFCQMFSKGRLLTFHRGELQQVLAHHISSSCEIHYSKHLLTYNEEASGNVVLSFTDGSTACCDILVAADGLKSACRGIIFRRLAQAAKSNGRYEEAKSLLACVEPIWSGSIAYRSLIPLDPLEDASTTELEISPVPIMYVGKDANLIVYPVAQGNLLNVVLHHTRPELQGMTYDGPWSEEVELDELLNITDFSSWEPQVQAIMQRIVKPTKWVIHTTRPLPTFSSGRVALLGDSGHGMTAFQGSGAGQAIEDAYVLAELLGHRQTTINTVSQALRIYDEIRRPFSTDIARRSFEIGRYVSLNHDGYDFDTVTDESELESTLREMGDIMIRESSWAWSSTVEESLAEGVQRLVTANL